MTHIIFTSVYLQLLSYITVNRTDTTYQKYEFTASDFIKFPIEDTLKYLMETV